MFAGVVALRYQHHTIQVYVALMMEGNNSHKHSQNPLTNKRVFYNIKLPHA